MGQPIKFYTDEHVAKAVVQGLRQRGVVSGNMKLRGGVFKAAELLATRSRISICYT